MFSKHIFSNICLIVASLIWGTAFVAQTTGMDHIGPLTFTNIRFLIGGLIVFPLAIKEIPKFIEQFLKKNRLKKTSIKYFILHQASKYVCDKIKDKLGLAKKFFLNNYQNYGNTVSSTIPLLLEECIKKKKIKKKDIIILCGFGVGLSWGIAKIKW